MDRQLPTTTAEDASRELVRRLLAKKGITLPGDGRITGIGRRPEDAPARLSFPQQRLWFLHQLDPGSAAYNLSAAFSLEGRLDDVALTRALQSIVDRHDALRTTFHADDGEGVYRVTPACEVTIARADLSAVAAAACAAAIDAHLTRLAGEPFDLARGPLLRVGLLCLGPERHVLVLVVHHIVFDGWSIEVLVRELGAAYAAFAQGRAPSLPALPVQYQDFAHWQRSRADGPALRDQRTWWISRLQGLAPLDLPTDRRRPARPTLAGSSHAFRLSPALSAAIRGLARQHDATPFMVLLAGFFVLLHRYTGRDDVAVGSPIANRRETEIEGLIGLFANTLVLRADLAGRPTFAGLLARVRALTLEAYQHQDVPFEQLVEVLQPDRDTGRQPLFQVAFAMQHAGIDRLELAGLTLAPRVVPSTASKFDLTVALTEAPDSIAGSVEFSTDLFEPATVARMMRHYEALLASAVGDPARAIADLSWRSAGGDAGASTDARREHVPVGERLHERFARQAAATPAATAVTCDGEHLTYADLDARANRLAAFLRTRCGVGVETRIGLFLERSIDMVVAILGVLKAGAAYVPIDPASPADRAAFIASDAGVLAVLTQASVAARLPSLEVPVIVLDEAADDIARESATAIAAVGDVASAAYVIYTSGSTGRPKGVVVQHDHVQRLFLATDRWFGFGAADVWTLFHSYGFDFSVWEIWGALLYGGRLVVVPYLVSRSPDAFHRLLDRERVTVLNQTPSAFTQLVAADARAGVGASLALRWVIFGGEALDLESLRPWFARHGDARPRLVNMYGITETTVHVTYRLVTRADVDSGAGSVIGEAIPDLVVHLCDDEMRLVPPGVPGEMYVGGAGVARGYLGRPDLTATRFVPDPFSREPGARLYRSGDRARWRSDGDLEYLGRLDDQVKIRGFRIELGEIENVLLAHPGVSAAVVVARRDGEADPRLVAYVVIAGDEPPSRADLRRWAQGRLPDYMVPAVIMPVPAIPLTAHGKVDRRALPEPDHDRADDQLFVAPSTAAEAALADIWRDVLSLDRVGVADNFFTLGGDSIRAIKVVSRARERGLAFTLADLFQHQTIRGLAGHAAAATAEAPAARAPFALISAGDRARLAGPDIEDAWPLTLLQRGMLFHSRFSAGASAYHNVSSFHLRVRFEQAALEQAVDGLIAAHAILRASVNLTDYDEPLQVVHRTVACPLGVDDLRHLDEASQDAHLDAWFAAEQARHFDWTQPPLLRLHVHRRADDRIQLTLSEHHAILDGWSVASLLTELLTRYLAAIGEPVAAPSTVTASSFGDYVAEEHEARQSPEARAFWRQQLEEAMPARVTLPPDASGEPPSTASLVHRLVVPGDMVAGLQDLARTSGVSLKSVLLAAHAKVVAALGGTRDAVTGLVVNARPEGPDSDRVLGLFLNTVPFRIDVHARSWVDLIAGAQATERALLVHRGFPLAEMQRLHHGRPLFDVVFNYVHFHVYDTLGRLPALALIGERSFAETNFPLGASFSFDQNAGRLVLSLEAAAGVAGAGQLRELGERYVHVLAAMTRDPRQSPDAVSLVLPREQATVRPVAAVVEPDVARPFATERIARWIRETPDALAIASDEATWTYADLDARSRAWAARLAAAGVRRGDRVAIRTDMSAAYVVAVLGVWRAGAAFLPLDDVTPPERVRFMVADAGVRLLIVTRADTLAERHGCPVLWLEDEPSDTHDWPADTPVDADDLAYVIYTSGSTGLPKGVMVRHGGLANLCEAQIRRFGIEPASRTLLFASIGFDASVSEMFTTLGAGAALHLLPRGRRRSLDTLGRMLADGITVVTLPPTALAAMEDVPGPSLRTVVSAGEPLTPDLVKRWAPGRRLLNAYGPTEVTVCATMTGPLAEDVSSVPIGRAIEGAEVYVLDAAMQVVPPGVTGELHVGGAGLARGYLGRPDLTAERFVPHPFAGSPGARLYRTGDLARWRPDGQLDFLGRADHQVKVRGVRIELDEVAAVVREHPAVRDAVAVLRDADTRHPRLVAYVVAADQQAPTVDALRAFAADRLPDQAVPAAVVVLPALPLTTSGKVDRAALPDPGEARPDLEVPFVAPRTDVEARLADAWARALGVARVGVDDNFFSLGGDSIVSLQVVARAQASGIRVTPEDIFRHQTVAALAAVARVADRADAQARPSGTVPLTPVQQWFFEQRVPVRSHWNQALLLAVRPGDRSAGVQVDRLQQALDAVAEAHDALRLRFRHDGHAWTQWYDDEPARVQLERIDLSAVPDSTRAGALAEQGERLQRGLDLAHGPLVRAALIDLGPAQGQRLLIVAHHLIVDGVSWRVLIDDLQSALAAIADGRDPAVPRAATSFQQWSTALARHAASPSIQAQRTYWTSPAWTDRRPLPVDHPGTDASANLESTAATVDVFLDEAETSALLREVPPVYGTQINDALLAALGESVAAWTGDRVLVVELEGHGREPLGDADLDVSRTVGWFTTIHPVRLDLRGARGPGEGLKHVKEQLRAVPERGIGYGLLRYLGDADTKAILGSRPAPSISFNYLGQIDASVPRDARFGPADEAHGLLRDPGGERAHLIDVVAATIGGRLRVTWIFSPAFHRHDTMTRVADGFVGALRRLIAHCREPEAGGYTPSDFPEMDLSADELDALMRELDDRVEERE